jgi:hypothetical protein
MQFSIGQMRVHRLHSADFCRRNTETGVGGKVGNPNLLNRLMHAIFTRGKSLKSFTNLRVRHMQFSIGQKRVHRLISAFLRVKTTSHQTDEIDRCQSLPEIEIVSIQ